MLYCVVTKNDKERHSLNRVAARLGFTVYVSYDDDPDLLANIQEVIVMVVDDDINFNRGRLERFESLHEAKERDCVVPAILETLLVGKKVIMLVLRSCALHDAGFLEELHRSFHENREQVC